MKISNKINISFSTIFILIASIIGLIFGIYTTSLIKNDLYSYLSSINRTRAEHARTFIQEQQKAAVILAAASVYLDFLKEPTTSKQYPIIKDKIIKRFERTMEADSEIYEILIIDKNGKTIVSSNSESEGKDESKDEYFIKGKEGVYFKDVYFIEDKGKKDLTYAIAAPIKDNNGVLLGVSLLRYKPDHFYSIVKNENELSSTEENFLVNRDKFFITPSRFLGKDVILKQKVETNNVNNCFLQSEVDYVNKNGYSGLKEFLGVQIIENKDYRNVDVIGTHSYIPETGWCLITKVDKSDIMSFRTNLIIILSIILFIAELVFLFVGYLFSQKITNPIQILKIVVAKIKQGDYSYKTNINSKDEIGELAKGFDLMISAVKESRENIEKKVEERTVEIEAKSKEVENQKSAILNILEDVQKEKSKVEELASIVRDANEPIISQDLDGIILNWNHGAEESYGYTAIEMVGKSIEIIIPEDQIEINRNVKNSILSGKKVDHYQTKRKKKNGDLVDVSISISPIKDFSDKIIGLSVIALDITKEKEIDKAKTEFVSLASHQLRTPLSAINWYSEMLLAGDAGKLNEEQEKYLKEVYVGNQRMVALVNALLNVSRLDLGTFIIEPKEIDVVPMIKSVLGELFSQIKEKKQTINENYQDNLPKFQADESLLRIIFQNLLSNSVKYTPENGVISVNLSVVLKGENFGNKNMEKDCFAFCVSDSGIGIPVDQQDKIFSKLFRADNARETETEGTGLGLYIIKSITEKSEGNVWFESIENKGTTFYVVFPLSGMKKKEGSRKLD